MILKALVAGLLAVIPLTAHADTVTGSWTAETSDKSSDVLNFSMRTGGHENDGSRFKLADFTGLTPAQVRSASAVDVSFQLRREAGTIRYEGSFRNGEGAGTFTFQPDLEFPKKLSRLGVELEGKQRVERELFTLAIFDVSSSFIQSMQSIGYKEALEKYISFRIFAVDPGYVRDMAAAGFDHLSADKLVETRIQGATPDYIRDMRRTGNALTLDQYVESRIFQVTPEFAAEMSRAGYPGLDRDVLVQFRIQGVTTEFIQDLARLGYTKVPAEKLVEMRIHGVTPEFIRRLESAGYKHVPIDKMVQMRIFDIQPEMIRALDDAKGGT
jgi:hypothetical protein